MPKKILHQSTIANACIGTIHTETYCDRRYLLMRYGKSITIKQKERYD